MSLELRQSIGLRLTQQLVMTPQLQQAIRLLQLNRLELIDAIHAEMEQNPVLEEELRQDEDAHGEEAKLSGEEPVKMDPVTEPDKAQEVSGDNSATHEIDWEQWLDSYNSSAPLPGGIKRDAEDLPTLEQTLTKAETLFEHLTWQLSVSSLVEDDLKIAYEIIGSLDDKGFLPGDQPLEDIAIRLTEREVLEHAALKKPGAPTQMMSMVCCPALISC